MANTKPIIDIAVNDEAFRRFYDLFTDYRAKIEEMPEAWQRLNEAMEGAGAGGEALSSGALSAKEALALAGAQAALIVEGLHKAVKAQDALGDSTHSTNKKMSGLAKTAKSLGGEIVGIGKWILKLGEFSLAGLGIGGILGGFGIADLANSAFQQYRNAGQLGLSIGQLKSFDVNAQPYLNRTALQQAASIPLDIRNAGPLSLLNIPWAKATAESPIDLAAQLYRSAAETYRTLPHGQGFEQTRAGIAAKSLGLDVSQIRLISEHLKEFDESIVATHRDVKKYNVPDAAALAMVNLKKQFDAMGSTINNDLITRLAPLAPEIERLSNEILGFITTFIQGKDMDVILKVLEGGLKNVGDFLERKDVQAGFASFANFLGTTDWGTIGADIQQLGKEVVNALRWLHLIPDKNADKTPFQSGISGHTLQGDWKWAQEHGGIGGPQSAFGKAWAAVKAGLGSAGSAAAGAWKWATSPITGPAGAAVLQSAQEQQVDPLLALAVAMKESHLNPNVRVMDHYSDGTPAGYSTGLYQLNEHGEGAGMSVKDMLDPATNARVALAEIAKVAKAHPGWSPGRIAAAAQRPADPAAYAKAVNQNYEQLVRQARQASAAAPSDHHPAAKPTAKPRRVSYNQRPEVKVVVYNSTSARVAVSTNAVAVS